MKEVKLLSFFIVVVGAIYPNRRPAPVNPFLPAPPGRTPNCATNGRTYCENIETYPMETIRNLIYQYGNSYEPFVNNEIDRDFFMLSTTYGPYGYGEGTSYGIDGNSYSPPQQQFNYRTQERNNSNSYYPQRREQGFSLITAAIPPILHSIWWTHRTGGKSIAPYILQHRITRFKRQTTSEGQLCPVLSQFITPKAAMNNQGNWMFVVNMDDTRFLQQVKAESCAGGDGSSCSGLCATPPGYSATCRQQFVQKRLVALDGSGSRLRGDVFWFPHCCTCQIASL